MGIGPHLLRQVPQKVFWVCVWGGDEGIAGGGDDSNDQDYLIVLWDRLITLNSLQSTFTCVFFTRSSKHSCEVLQSPFHR